MDSEAMRGGRNQRESRSANARFLTVLNNADCPDGQLIPFLCECSDADCPGSVQITAWRYEDIHWDEEHYVILPGHKRIADEIVDENSYYEIVRKAA